MEKNSGLPRMSADTARMEDTLPRDESQYPHWELSGRILGAAFEVHRDLGPGFLEKVYEAALLQELGQAGIEAKAQAEIIVNYKSHVVGSYFADILVEDEVICEVKAVRALTSVHEAQLLHYLKATGIKLGLLLNFGADKVQFKRLVLSR